MSLHKKALCVIGAVVVALTVAFVAVSRIIILGGFTQLETQYTARNVQRALNTLLDELETLDTMNRDWSAWDDTYAFVETRYPEYVVSNLIDSTFVSNRLNLLLIVNTSGEFVYSKAFDLQEQTKTPVPDSVATSVRALLPLEDVDTYRLGIGDTRPGRRSNVAVCPPDSDQQR